MPKRRAQITREAAGEMYDDLIDRVAAQAGERAAPRREAETPEPEAPDKPFLVKATVYLTPEDVLAIDKIVSDEFRAIGRKPRRSTVVSRAIQLLAAGGKQGDGGGTAGERQGNDGGKAG
jgi:hypothetical protein